MSGDDPFRVALTAIFVLRSLFGFYFWRKACRGGEKLDRRQEGWLILVGLRLFAAVYGIGLLAWLIRPAWMTWSAMPLPLLVRWSGVALVFAGACVVTWGLQALGRNFTDTVVTRKEHTLVTTGPYRWVRNPLYSSYFVIVTGVTLLTANWFPLASGSMVLLFVFIRTRIEERNLLLRFGDEYREYMDRVGRFFPRFGARHRGGKGVDVC